jgi:serine/threonine-protein kinase
MSHRNRKRSSSFPPSVSHPSFFRTKSGSINSARPILESGRHAIEPSTHDGLPTPVPGMMVAGRFRMERRIASGAMGDVWQGVHCDLQLRVAIKTLRREMATNHEVVARFSREAFLLGRIQSDHVVRVLDFVADRRLGPVLVTELVDGAPLATILASRRFTVEEAIELAIDLVSGLRELHRARIVHRDVKPANVLMRRVDDQAFRAVFIDLGVSRLVTETEPSDACLTEITSAERAVGTYEYMAPEQVVSSKSVTPAADLYAVGAILYRAVAGRHAYGDLHGLDLVKRKLKDVAPALDTGRVDRLAKGFEEVVSRSLAISPTDRYEVADEMLADLSLLRDAARHAAQLPRPASDEGTVVAPPSSRLEGTKNTKKRESARGTHALAVVWVVAGLVVGVVTGAVAARRLIPQRCTVTATAADANGNPTYKLNCDR